MRDKNLSLYVDKFSALRNAVGYGADEKIGMTLSGDFGKTMSYKKLIK